MSPPAAVFQHLCWVKWRKLPAVLFHAIAERYDMKAYDQLAKVSRSFYRWSHGKLNFWDDLKIKGDEGHAYLMFAGLTGGRIEDLTQRELADFFDALCPCGEVHSEENLRKMRAKTRADLRKSIETVRRRVRAKVGASKGEKKSVRWRKRTCLICCKPYCRKRDRIA